MSKFADPSKMMAEKQVPFFKWLPPPLHIASGAPASTIISLKLARALKRNHLTITMAVKTMMIE
jgi:hypothetical protein